MAEFDELVAPIYNALHYYDNLGAARFHMPGHSGVNVDDWLFRAATNDITEMSFSDKLISPHGIIEQSEELMAATSGAMKVLYLTSGGTGAIFIAMATVKNFGKFLLTTLRQLPLLVLTQSRSVKTLLMLMVGLWHPMMLMGT